MVRSHSAHDNRPAPAGLQGTRRFFRDARPYLAIIAGFTAAALLIDFCFACLFQALR